tara:strand:+ start:6411 stop:6626 length:216 start_codon:yes stop_codon:yes gene_type:complete
MMTAMYKPTKDRPSRGLQYAAAYNEAENRFYSKHPERRKDNSMIQKAMNNPGLLVEEVEDKKINTVPYGKD